MSRDCEVPTYIKVVLLDGATVIKYGTWLARPGQLMRGTRNQIEENVGALLDEAILRTRNGGHPLYELEACRALEIDKDAFLIVAVGGPLQEKAIQIAKGFTTCYKLSTLGDDTP